MPDVLIHGDTVRSPELRHEVPLAIPDPFLYVERDGSRHLVLHSLEHPRVEALGLDLELHPLEEFGYDELVARRLKQHEVYLEVHRRASQALGVASALTPPDFPLQLADHLRAGGIELVPDADTFQGRRRVKNDHELAGIRRAQRATEAGMARAVEMLRDAEMAGDGLTLAGEPLTSERIRRAIVDALGDHGAAGDELIVSHGPQSAVGHELGSGRILAGEPVVIDRFPRDGASACYADMTRTFVVGDVPDEIREYHRLCREALERVLPQIRPGVTGRELFTLACDLFHEHGYKTQLNKEPGEVLQDGFFHSLGHGVGLEVHEQPKLGRLGDEPLVAGDVVAVEPGLYRSGFGGVRLEDLVLVTEDGAENLTDFPYELEPR